MYNYADCTAQRLDYFTLTLENTLDDLTFRLQQFRADVSELIALAYGATSKRIHFEHFRLVGARIIAAYHTDTHVQINVHYEEGKYKITSREWQSHKLTGFKGTMQQAREIIEELHAKHDAKHGVSSEANAINAINAINTTNTANAINAINAMCSEQKLGIVEPL